MDDKKRTIIPVVMAIAVVTVLGTAGYVMLKEYLTERAAILAVKIAGWKIYENDNYGFRAEYPSYFELDPHLPQEYAADQTWLLNRYENNQIINLIMKGPVGPEKEKVVSFADYGVDYDNKKYTCIGACGGEILKLPAISGKKSVTFITFGLVPDVIDARATTLIQKDENTMIEISIYGNDSRKDVGEENSYRLQILREKIIKLNDQILSTFEFTK